jgi:hypothetical protein
MPPKPTRRASDRRNEQTDWQPRTMLERFQVVMSVPFYWVVTVIAGILINIGVGLWTESKYRNDISNKFDSINNRLETFADFSKSQVTTNQLVLNETQEMKRRIAVIETRQDAIISRAEENTRRIGRMEERDLIRR